jgi:ammonium transporter Rh
MEKFTEWRSFMEGFTWEIGQYNFMIGILAMLLLGFGFLMVFVKKNGFSALTGTYVIVAGVLPLYMLLKSFGLISAEHLPVYTIESILFAEFTAAAALIAMGAVLGRLKIFQYLLLGVIIVPFYMLAEWLVTDGGLGITNEFVDTAGSIGIHAFGAYFGLALTLVFTTKEHKAVAIESDHSSDRFSIIGSMLLWVFWPSFCSAIVEPTELLQTSINTILALCGATLATFISTSLCNKGKISIADIANATLAGGVAIGSTCNIAEPFTAFVIGVCAGILSTIGFRFIQPALESKLGLVDTCGVHNLHGMPGLFGGLIAIILVPSAAASQLVSIAVVLLIAIIGGVICGLILKTSGTRKAPYDDAEEFIME